MEFPPLHPRPSSLELLLLQAEHRSSYIWEGELLAQTLRSRRRDGMWDFLKDHQLHPCVVKHLQDTGFYRIIEIGRLQLDWSLITALIERWRPETHIFDLPIGEATITLQDVEVLYGLPINGLAVALPQGMRDYTGAQYLDTLQRLTDFRPEDDGVLVGASRLALTPIRLHLEAMHDDITHDTPELHIMCWDAAVLGYLYRQMCQACMGSKRDVAGFMPLLQVTVALTTPSTKPASLTDDHTAAHLPIKRRRDEDDLDSVAGQDGMCLRPTAALKHKGCGTH
ncbi:serine/threonine-protein phosphatase 7 long form homolog [Nicotiana tabacum]|uniref:Serine/threonine-protein phosphatase 7 long form homolog n=1 Tax=Nicotiana tabacum TaxID=4097 RepID=A0AC58U2L8_TOBAC